MDRYQGWQDVYDADVARLSARATTKPDLDFHDRNDGRTSAQDA